LIFPDTIDKIIEVSRQAIIEQKPDMPEDQIETALGITKRFIGQ